MTPLILASKSPARAALLRAAGIDFEVRESGVDEDPLKVAWLTEAWSAHAVAEGLAVAKALAVSHQVDGLVIGADQTLEFEGRLLDKAADAAEARQRLAEFRGHEHRLHSAVVLARGGKVIWHDTPSATLHVREFSDEWLEDYLAQAGEALTESVGGYHLEGLGVQLFDRVEGDWFTVLGLPMLGLLQALRREGALGA